MMNERGFTLVELVAASAVLALVLAGTLALHQQGLNAYLFSSGRTAAQDNGRGAVTRIAREFLTASVVTASAACATGTNDITFTYIDDAGASVTVRYNISGTNLQRNQSAPVPPTAQPDILVGGVQSLTIVCYDGTSPTPVATSTPANVRSLDITVTTTNEDASAGASFAAQGSVFEARVRARNM